MENLHILTFCSCYKKVFNPGGPKGSRPGLNQFSRDLLEFQFFLDRLIVTLTWRASPSPQVQVWRTLQVLGWPGRRTASSVWTLRSCEHPELSRRWSWADRLHRRRTESPNRAPGAPERRRFLGQLRSPSRPAEEEEESETGSMTVSLELLSFKQIKNCFLRARGQRSTCEKRFKAPL